MGFESSLTRLLSTRFLTLNQSQFCQPCSMNPCQLKKQDPGLGALAVNIQCSRISREKGTSTKKDLLSLAFLLQKGGASELQPFFWCALRSITPTNSPTAGLTSLEVWDISPRYPLVGDDVDPCFWRINGYGSKSNQETTGFSSCFHLTRLHFGYLCLTAPNGQPREHLQPPVTSGCLVKIDG